MKSIEDNIIYPDISAITPNLQAARIISPAYAGQRGELAAVLLYTYQHLQFKNQNLPEIASAIEEISVTEMRHFELLGEMLIRLGVNPIFTANPPLRNNYFTTRDIPYETRPREMLNIAINGERRAIREYTAMLERLNDPIVASVIERIIQDEQLHVETLQRLIDSLN